MRRTLVALLVGATCALSVPAFAQPKPAEPTTKYQQKTRIIFEPHEVGGGRGAPLGSVVTGAPTFKTSKLITVRRHFLPEMIKTAENL